MTEENRRQYFHVLKQFHRNYIEENREAVAELIRIKGFTVEEAVNGKEALEKNTTFQAHIFLLDVVMPEMSGITLLKRLNVKDNMHEAIMMTGHENAKKAMEYGALCYISKPVIREKLYEQVDKALSMVRKNQEELEYQNKLEREVKKRTRKLVETLGIMQDQSQRLDTIINSMEEGLLAIDNEENVVLMNNQVQSILNVQFAECAGQNIWKVLNDKGINEQLRPILTNRHHRYYDKNVISVNGKNRGYRHFNITVTEIAAHDGQNTGTIITFSDQTDKIEADQMRNHFLTVVSHELRTPLSIMMNYLALLGHKNYNPEKIEEIIKDMTLTGRGLKYLVNNIVDLSNLSATNKTLNPEKKGNLMLFIHHRAHRTYNCHLPSWQQLWNLYHLSTQPPGHKASLTIHLPEVLPRRARSPREGASGGCGRSRPSGGGDSGGSDSRAGHADSHGDRRVACGSPGRARELRTALQGGRHPRDDRPF